MLFQVLELCTMMSEVSSNPQLTLIHNVCFSDHAGRCVIQGPPPQCCTACSALVHRMQNKSIANALYCQAAKQCTLEPLLPFFISYNLGASTNYIGKQVG